jgi:hypothetical protein
MMTPVDRKGGLGTGAVAGGAEHGCACQPIRYLRACGIAATVGPDVGTSADPGVPTDWHDWVYQDHTPPRHRRDTYWRWT